MRARDGSVRAYAIVDAEDAARVNESRWALTSAGHAFSSRGYLNAFVLGGKPGPGKWLQFINKNPLDCRKENIRIRTRYVDVWGEVGLWRNYQITREIYAQMLEAQNGVCAICKRAPEERAEKTKGVGKVPARQRKLCVDHDHATKKVRALLCWSCNTGLGKFEDDPALVCAALDYLELHT